MRSAPVELGGTAASRSFSYDGLPIRTRTTNEEISFSLQTPGEYSYEFVVRDQFHGEVAGHKHEHRQIFTIRVAAVIAD